MDTINIKYLLWSVNTGKIGQVALSIEVDPNQKLLQKCVVNEQ
jgi:hypothetical protein